MHQANGKNVQVHRANGEGSRALDRRNEEVWRSLCGGEVLLTDEVERGVECVGRSENVVDTTWPCWGWRRSQHCCGVLGDYVIGTTEC